MRYQADIVRVYTCRQWLPWRPWYALGMDQRVCALDLVRERIARPVKRINHFRRVIAPTPRQQFDALWTVMTNEQRKAYAWKVTLLADGRGAILGALDEDEEADA